jgi:hypothetical protein
MNIKIVYENRQFASIASINDLTGIINLGNGSQKVLKVLQVGIPRRLQRKP